MLATPPVAPIAQALAAMNDKSGAPLLAQHLLDPADTLDDVRETATALLVLAGPSEMGALKQFFAMYRGTAEGPDMGAAVVSVGQALLKVGDKEGRAIVDLAIKDPLTVSFVKERLDAIVQAMDAQKPPAADAAPSSSSKPGDAKKPK